MLLEIVKKNIQRNPNILELVHKLRKNPEMLYKEGITKF